MKATHKSTAVEMSYFRLSLLSYFLTSSLGHPIPKIGFKESCYAPMFRS